MNEYLPCTLPALLVICGFLQLFLSKRLTDERFEKDALFMRVSAYFLFALGALVLIILLF